MVVWGGRAGRGWGGEIAATVQKPPLLASPSLSTSDCDRVFLCACMCRCVFLYESVCVRACVCLHLLESLGESQRDVADKCVALGRGRILDFTPFFVFFVFQLLGSCEFIFIQSLRSSWNKIGGASRWGMWHHNGKELNEAWARFIWKMKNQVGRMSISETFEGLWNIISPPTWKWCQLPVQLAFFFSTSSLNGPPVVDLQRVNVFQDMFLFDILTYHTGIGCMNI